MGLLGKILIFFNILAAGAYMYCATMSWGKRQAWSYAVLRYEIMITGLPVEELPDADKSDPEVVPFEHKYADSPRVHAISDKALKSIFADAPGGDLGGDPVNNQIDEVKRVRAKIEQAIANAEGAEGKRVLIRSLLFNQARNGEERDRFAALTATPATIEDARKELDNLFTAALSPAPETSATDKADVPVKRRTIAHLLYHLSDQEIWHKRVMTVVGLQSYVQAIDAQAAEMVVMVQRLKFIISDEQAKFEPQYQAIVQRCLFQQQELEKLQAVLMDQKTLVSGHEIIRNSRANEVDTLEKEHAKLSGDAKMAIAQQAVAEKQLFLIHQQLNQALETIVSLEETLRKVELLNTNSNNNGR